MNRSLSDYMSTDLIAFLNVETRDQALLRMVELIYNAGAIKDQQGFFNAILQREGIVTTGVGMGIAIPHAKLPSYNHFFIGIGILQKPVDWDSLDGSLVRLVFMIGGPDDKQTEYLQILSSLTQTIKDEDRRKKLLNCTTAAEVFQLFQAAPGNGFVT